jgi:nitrogen fixation protein NifU and related proteins
MRELYQQLIVDHGRRPRNFHRLESFNHMMVGNNPLCGDKLVVYVKEDNGIITDVSFEGEGCAISMASASLMTEALKGKTKQEALALYNSFHDQLVLDTCEDVDLGKLNVLLGVKDYPMRVKCATLAWHAFDAALDDEDNEVCTE